MDLEVAKLRKRGAHARADSPDDVVRDVDTTADIAEEERV